MNRPKVSIIVPVFNVESYVASCLQSVMKQTYQGSMQCVIVDDCSTDKSLDIVNRLIADYQGTIHFVVLHHDSNRGQSAARNTGMRVATGDYIFFLDSDDEITTDCIEKLTAPLAEENYDLVVGDIRTIGDEKLNALLKLKLSDGEVLRRKEIERTYLKKWNVAPVNKLYRATFVRQQRLLFKEGIFYEDELWSLQVACLANSLRAVNHISYLYKIREGSTTTAETAASRRVRAYKVIVVEICTFLKERRIFSVRAYQLMQKFFYGALQYSLCDEDKFIRDYCELRKAAYVPFTYRIFASGLNFRVHLRNLYYILPPRLAAKMIYQRSNV